MYRKRDIKGVEEDINRLEMDIVLGKSEIKEQLNRMGTAGLNIDHLESELADEKNDFEEAKQMVTDCKKQIGKDNVKLDKLKTKLIMMTGDGEIEYIRPCEKTRPVSETTLLMHRC